MTTKRCVTALVAVAALLLPTAPAAVAAGNATTAPAGARVDPKPPEFQGDDVTDDRKDSVKQAHRRAMEYAEAALAAVPADKAPPGPRTYAKWFGAFDTTRRDKVRATFAAVVNYLRDETITYDIHGEECTTGEYSYAFYEDDYLYLCPRFWELAASGTNSKPGTIIHEVTHMAADTEDHRYGRAKSHKLAEDDPDQAVENADNYQYFAEHEGGD